MFSKPIHCPNCGTKMRSLLDSLYCDGCDACPEEPESMYECAPDLNQAVRYEASFISALARGAGVVGLLASLFIGGL